MNDLSSKEKGNLLERIVEKLCADYTNAKVTRGIKFKGRSGVDREIDVMIDAVFKSFDIKIIIEAKNYAKKVDIGVVDALKTKLNDVGGNLGVIVCSHGFTAGALKAAELHGIQLFQVFDHELGNTMQLIPLRYVVPFTKSYSLRIEHGASGGGNFELPTDTKEWRFYVEKKVLNQKELVTYAWNRRMFPQKPGTYMADFGVVKISTAGNPAKFYYPSLGVKTPAFRRSFQEMLEFPNETVS